MDTIPRYDANRSSPFEELNYPWASASQERLEGYLASLSRVRNYGNNKGRDRSPTPADTTSMKQMKITKN